MRGNSTLKAVITPAINRLPYIRGLVARVNELERQLGGDYGPGFQVLPSPAWDYLAGLSHLALCQAAATGVQQVVGKRELRAGIIGSEARLLFNAEPLADYGYTVVKYFGMRPGDPMHRNHPLDSLTPNDFDVLLLGGNLPDEEQGLFEQVCAVREASGGEWPRLLRIVRLKAAVEAVLKQLRGGTFCSCLGPVKLAALATVLSVTPPRGCIVECGSYLGGSAIFMGLLLRELQDARRVHAFDTFEGIPAPVAADGETPFQQGLFSESSLPLVARNVAAYGLTGTVVLHKGLVQDSVPRVLGDVDEISFAFVDTDQYAGTQASLREIIPRLGRDGCILIDDSSLHGVKAAIREAQQEYPWLCVSNITYNFCLLSQERRACFFSHWPP